MRDLASKKLLVVLVYVIALAVHGSVAAAAPVVLAYIALQGTLDHLAARRGANPNP